MRAEDYTDRTGVELALMKQSQDMKPMSSTQQLFFLDMMWILLGIKT